MLSEIISIKMIAWPYSYDSQLNWLDLNLKNNDIHVMLYSNSKLVAYMNLIQIELLIDSVKYGALGIGNVCAFEKGKGYGKVLMNFVNNYLVDNLKVGLLFCKSELKCFYISCSWKLVLNNKLVLSNMQHEVNTMIYNYTNDFISVSYIGDSF